MQIKKCLPSWRECLEGPKKVRLMEIWPTVIWLVQLKLLNFIEITTGHVLTCCFLLYLILCIFLCSFVFDLVSLSLYLISFCDLALIWSICLFFVIFLLEWLSVHAPYPYVDHTCQKTDFSIQVFMSIFI
jgi:hypothetical protein